MLSDLRPDTGDSELIVILVLQGCGVGLASMPVTVAAMNSLPQRYVAQGGAMSNLNRQVAGALGLAVFGAMLVAQIGTVAPANTPTLDAQEAFNKVFLVGFVVSVLGLG